jgi:histone H3/H4
VQNFHYPSEKIILSFFTLAPVLFAKACEIFILEMTLRAWGAAEKSKRRTLQKEDIEAAIKNTEIFDFLVGL